MRLVIGVILVVLGLPVMGYAGYRAVEPLAQLYQSTLDNPMADSDPKATSAEMLKWAGIAIGGAFATLIGWMIVKIELVRKGLRMVRRASPPRQPPPPDTP